MISTYVKFICLLSIVKSTHVMWIICYINPMDITVVSLNPSIDWQWSTPSFVYGGLNRVKSGRRYVSGKGINVCAALKNLGRDPLCIGFNFRENGNLVTGALDEWGVRYNFIDVDGAVRVNIKLYDESSGTMTELNQPGDFVPEKSVAELYGKALAQSKAAPPLQAVGQCSNPGILVLSGSMPAGVPKDIYKRLCSAWPGMTILDADGEALRLALTGGKPPFLIKPNLFELTNCFGVELPTKESIAAFCKKLIHEYGVGMICVSMGADGAMLVTGSDAFYVAAPLVKVRGVQGAGDAMVAGLVYGLTNRLPEPELLRVATAAAAASVERDGTLMCTWEGFQKFLSVLPKASVLVSN